jgi:hypothetical protein
MSMISCTSTSVEGLSIKATANTLRCGWHQDEFLSTPVVAQSSHRSPHSFIERPSTEVLVLVLALLLTATFFLFLSFSLSFVFPDSTSPLRCGWHQDEFLSTPVVAQSSHRSPHSRNHGHLECRIMLRQIISIIRSTLSDPSGRCCRGYSQTRLTRPQYTGGSSVVS